MKNRFKFRAWYPKREAIENHMCGGFWIGGDEPDIYKYECKVMQCTGMKDDEDKLIYEGDILEIGSTIFEVKWGVKYGTGWIIECIQGSKFFRKSSLETLSPNLGKVVGNIYENPEFKEI